MTADLLETVSRGEDRDHAPFFAGRETEIGKFEEAVERSKKVRQTQFRIFHGAPGSGKTSLLAHLRDNALDNRVFVDVGPEDLTSRRALMVRINAKLHDAPSPVAKRVAALVRHAMGLAELALPAPRAKAVGGAAGTAIETGGEMRDARKRAALRERSELVLLLDEAQCLDGRHADVLRSLHTTGLEDMHTTFAFAGLGHTPSVVRNMKGLSRLAKNAEVYMDLLSEDECVESTRRMLDECGIGGDPVLREDVARRAASMARRWPQHLACAHAALARELIRTGWDVGRVDLDVVERETTEDRHEYYRGRLAGTVLGMYPAFTAAVVAAVRRDEPEDPGTFQDTCERMLGEARPERPSLEKVSGGGFAAALVERGVLVRPPGGKYEVPIPSMETWLDEMVAPRGQRRGTGRGGRD